MGAGTDNLKDMSVRWRELGSEVAKFMTVGGVATAVSFVLFNLLVHGGPGFRGLMPEHPIPAYVLANSVGMLISYHGSRNWAFRDRETTHPDGGITAYVVINLATFLLPVACLTVSRDLFGLADPVSDNISANVIGASMATWARFYLFRKLVFKRPVPLLDMYEELGEEFAEEERTGKRLNWFGSTASSTGDRAGSPDAARAGD